MKRRTLLLGTGAALFAVTVSRPDRARAEGQAPQVVIDHHSFAPEEIEVRVGTEVQWINRDGDEHNVTEKSKKFQSPVLDTGEQWKRTFTEPGTVEYYCSLHPHMVGRIKVVA